MLVRRESEKRVFNFHINFYSDWNEFYDDDFIIQIIKHASCCSEVAISLLLLRSLYRKKEKVIKTVKDNFPDKQQDSVFSVVSCGVSHLLLMHKKNNMLREKRKHANYKPNRR